MFIVTKLLVVNVYWW